MPNDTKYGHVTLERGSIPDDEGVFIFRYRDEMVPSVLAYYRTICLVAGSPQHHIDSIDRAITDVRDWQAEHPGRVVVPTSDTLLGPTA